MSLDDSFYFCSECKKVTNDLSELYFVEENSNRGFCSESCVEDFYGPFIKYFDQVDLEARKQLLISDEHYSINISEKDLVEAVLESPTEIWVQENLLDEKIHRYFKNLGDFTCVVTCLVYHGEASFIFQSTKTSSLDYLKILKIGSLVSLKDVKQNSDSSLTDTDGHEGDDTDFQFIQELENKKSQLLAEILTKRVETDIPFEDFDSYESCFQESITFPDEVFESKDKEGDSIIVYIKSFSNDSYSYFYIITCLKKKNTDTDEEINVFPILAFPTNDLALYSEFRSGKRVQGPLKN